MNFLIIYPVVIGRANQSLRDFNASSDLCNLVMSDNSFIISLVCKAYLCYIGFRSLLSENCCCVPYSKWRLIQKKSVLIWFLSFENCLLVSRVYSSRFSERNHFKPAFSEWKLVVKNANKKTDHWRCNFFTAVGLVLEHPHVKIRLCFFVYLRNECPWVLMIKFQELRSIWLHKSTSGKWIKLENRNRLPEELKYV